MPYGSLEVVLGLGEKLIVNVCGSRLYHANIRYWSYCGRKFTSIWYSARRHQFGFGSSLSPGLTQWTLAVHCSLFLA